MKRLMSSIALILFISGCASAPLAVRMQTEPPAPPVFTPSLDITEDALPPHAVSASLRIGEVERPLVHREKAWHLGLSAEEVAGILAGQSERTVPAVILGTTVNPKGVHGSFRREIQIEIGSRAADLAQSK